MSIRDSESIEQFQERVSKSSQGISSFQIEAEDKTKEMLQFASRTFNFKVNGLNYKVYPHMPAILTNTTIDSYTKKSINKLTLP